MTEPSEPPSGKRRRKPRPSEEALRRAWAEIYHLETFDLWRYRSGLLCIVALLVLAGLGTPLAAWSVLGVIGIILTLPVLLGIRRRYRDHPDRRAAERASRGFWRYVLTGREP